MMCLLISVEKDSSKPREIAAKLGDMRVRVRKEHVDIRMNSRVAKTLFDFIKGITVEDPDPVNGGLKRKREEDGATEQSRQGKGRKEEAGSTPTQSQSSMPVLPPPRPDRPLAIGDLEAKNNNTPVRVSWAKTPPTGPAALRNV